MARTFQALCIFVWHYGVLRNILLVNAEQVYAAEEPIQHLKQQLNDQQQQVATLQREVAQLLGDVRQRKSDFQGGGNAGVGGGLSLSISFPQPGTSKPAISQEVAAAVAGAAAEEATKGPIPVMAVKPTAVADLEGAMMQVMEQDAAMTGQQVAEMEIPEPLVEKSPEQEMNEAIAAIDKLEALKTHYKYDMRNIQRNYAS